MSYDIILVGGISFDVHGRALGPFRLRTEVERAGYSLKVVDYAWAFDQDQFFNLLSVLITEKTKILGISAAWFDIRKPANQWLDVEFFDRFRKKFPGVLIVVGGTKPTVPSLMHNKADWFISGFGEIALVKLMNYLTNENKSLKFITEGHLKIILANNDYQVANIDDIETVFKLEDGFHSYQPLPLEVSRGCIFKCAFCTHPFLGKKTYEYIRSAESIGRELKRNYELFGTTRYLISDDTFNDSYEKLDIVRKAIDLAKIPNFEFCGYIRPELIITKPKMLSMLLSLGLKAGHIGLESMRDESRKIVGKGIDVNRVFEVAHTLNSNGVKLHASLIAGLPNDTEEEIYRWNDFLIENRNDLFKNWNFNALGIQRTGTGDIPYSLIEKNPEHYGYTTSINEEIPNAQELIWTHSSGMTLEKARMIARHCNGKSVQYRKFAGWEIGSAWFHNLSDDMIENTVGGISLEIRKILLENGHKRALHNYNNLVHERN